MRRRFLIAALGGLICAISRTYAQQQSVPIIGLLVTHPPVTDPVVDSLRRGLREHGYDDGRTVKLEVRTALAQLDRVPALADELVRLPADVIVVVNEIALRAVQQATDVIPIVTVGYTDDPVSQGWIESYRRPGGNITGIYNVNSALITKRLEILKEALPKASRVAVLWDPTFGQRQLDELQQTSQVQGIQLHPIALRRPGDLEEAFKSAKAKKASAVLLIWSPLFYLQRTKVAMLALEARLPVISDLDVVTYAGSLMSYGSDGYYPFQRAAYFIDRLLKGAKASDLPVEQVSKLKLAVNMKTAKALGIVIPQSILVRADEVIR